MPWNDIIIIRLTPNNILIFVVIKTLASIHLSVVGKIK